VRATADVFEPEPAAIAALRPDVIAAGNIGCMTQIAAGTKLPTVHTVELIDWATGGAMSACASGALPSRTELLEQRLHPALIV
jgi:hypothetical protein